jgi:hypothetical protein
MQPAAHNRSRKLRCSSALGLATTQLTLESGLRMQTLFSEKDGWTSLGCEEDTVRSQA